MAGGVSIAAGALVVAPTSRCRVTPLVCWQCGTAPGCHNSILAPSPTATQTTAAGAPVSAQQTQVTTKVSYPTQMDYYSQGMKCCDLYGGPLRQQTPDPCEM